MGDRCYRYRLNFHQFYRLFFFGHGMGNKRSRHLWIVFPVVVAASALWVRPDWQKQTSVYVPIDLKWLSNEARDADCVALDGRKVTIQGSVFTPTLPGGPPAPSYRIYYHYSGDHPWPQKRVCSVIPFAGDVVYDQMNATVNGTLRAASDAATNSMLLTLSPDDSVTNPNLDLHGTALAKLIGLTPALCGNSVLVMALVSSHRIYGRKRLRPGMCVLCGYGLSATPDRCPECGKPRRAAHSTTSK